MFAATTPWELRTASNETVWPLPAEGRPVLGGLRHEYRLEKVTASAQELSHFLFCQKARP
jgi:hypothetical protein